MQEISEAKIEHISQLDAAMLNWQAVHARTIEHDDEAKNCARILRAAVNQYGGVEKVNQAIDHLNETRYKDTGGHRYPINEFKGWPWDELG